MGNEKLHINLPQWVFIFLAVLVLSLVIYSIFYAECEKQLFGVKFGPTNQCNVNNNTLSTKKPEQHEKKEKIVNKKEPQQPKSKPIQKVVEIKMVKKTYYLWRSDVDRSGPDYIYIGCGDPNSWAVKMCYSEIEIKSIRSDSGGSCGHTLYEVKCNPK